MGSSFARSLVAPSPLPVLLSFDHGNPDTECPPASRVVLSLHRAHPSDDFDRSPESGRRELMRGQTSSGDHKRAA